MLIMSTYGTNLVFHVHYGCFDLDPPCEGGRDGDMKCLAGICGLVAIWVTGNVIGEQDATFTYGHSAHGEAFNEGPRQAAYMMDGMAEIDFPVTTSNEAAQAFFNQGVSQLHGFWYFEAERSFRQVLALDPNCRMVYWGITMANVDNPERAAKLIKDKEKDVGEITRREQLYLQSLADYYRDLKKDEKERRKKLIRAYELIVDEFPNDVEAKAFLLFQVWHNDSRGKMQVSSHMAMSALADQVLAKNPAHPVHHYRIHLWDHEKKERALDAAANCGLAAPGIAHMWHMPGHTYSGLKRYVDAAWQQEASARVDHAHMIRDRVMPLQIHNYAHNNSWLADNLIFIGRVNDAIDLEKNMIELPRMPKFKADGCWDPSRSSQGSGQRKLLRDLLDFERYEMLLALDAKGYLDPLGNTDAEMRRYHGLGVAYYELKQREKGQEQIRALRALQSTLKRTRYEAAEKAESNAKAEKKKAEEVTKAMAKALQDRAKPIESVQRMIDEVSFIRDLNRINPPEDIAERAGRVKGVSKTRMAQIWKRLGDIEKAEKVAAEAVKSGVNRVLPLAVQIDVLHRAGKQEDAVKAFESLRKISAQIDLDLPAMQRIGGIARKQGWPEDWRLAHEPAKDLGARPPLDSLGPFRWRPYEAPSWAMKDLDGKEVRLEDYRGKPVVLIYYLGSGCKHCIEQLDAFSGVAEQYQELQIPIVAVSRESVSDLHKTRDMVADDDWFPFTVLSDEAMENFKSYRAYDDFEDLALHGTYLIDGDGLVRWQDISFEPFMHPEFLLEEAERLLAF